MITTLRFNFKVILDSILGWSNFFRVHRLTLVSAKHEQENVMTFVFKSNKKLTFHAGQYGVWFHSSFVKGKPARLFTVASAPSESVVQLSTRISNSHFKQRLSKLTPGDKMYMCNPIGRFVVTNQTKQVVMIAGGIGITPFRAITKDIVDTKKDVQTHLIYSAHDTYLYKDQLAALCTSSEFVTKDGLETAIKKVIDVVPPSIPFYLSGPPAFVVSTEKLLKAHGVATIKTDGFLGY